MLTLGVHQKFIMNPEWYLISRISPHLGLAREVIEMLKTRADCRMFTNLLSSTQSGTYEYLIDRGLIHTPFHVILTIDFCWGEASRSRVSRRYFTIGGTILFQMVKYLGETLTHHNVSRPAQANARGLKFVVDSNTEQIFHQYSMCVINRDSDCPS